MFWRLSVCCSCKMCWTAASHVTLCNWYQKLTSHSHHLHSVVETTSNCFCSMESLGRAVWLACMPIPFNPTLVIHHYILFVYLFNSSPFLVLQAFPSLLHHSVGLQFYPNSQSCGFHTRFRSIIYEQTRCHTHKHMWFLCQYTTSTTRVSRVECLFLRSAEVLWWS